MSFSAMVKSELFKTENAGPCCTVAELSAIFHTAGSISISGGGLQAELSTESLQLINKISHSLKTLFNISPEVFSEKKSNLKKNELYTLRTPSGSTEFLLKELEILYLDGEGYRQIASGVPKYITEQSCCALSYLKGAFLACGSISVPQFKNTDKASAGYHLEIKLPHTDMADSLRALFERFNIPPKIAERQGGYAVYLKESERISDFLALIGATNAVLKLQNVVVEREVKNNTNRQTNCIFANIDKTVDAAQKQIQAINRIESTVGLAVLPPKLQAVAKLRQEYPDFSLEQIAGISPDNLTKSGLYHRMRRIIQISKQL